MKPLSALQLARSTLVVMLILLSACSQPTPAPTPAPTSPPDEATETSPQETAESPTQPPAAVAKNPSASGPIAISDDDALLVVANTLNGSISVINVAADANTKLGEVKTGEEPRSVVISPDKRLAYVTNQRSATVSVVDLEKLAKVTDIPVGIEPYGIALTPDGGRAYVANSSSNTVSIIDTASNTVIGTIPIPGIQPRGIAITNNNGGSGPQFVYVTQFLSQPTASGGPSTDQGSEGKVFVISTADDTQIQGVIALAAHDTGFTADRTRFGGTDKEATFAYPNQLQAIVLKNGRGYLPNVAASPEGPVRFNVDTQAFLSVFDVASKAELPNGTINLHAAARAQTFTPKLFFANPWAIAFEHESNEGYVVSAGSDVVVKITLDDGGVPSVVLNPAEGDTTRVAFIEVGKNPRGIVINNADTRAYVANYISKDVSVIDLTAEAEEASATIQSVDLPAAGSEAAKFLLGNELFNASRGEFDEGVAERMSNEGWQACASCHPDGLSDGVIWQFASGPRKSLPLNSTYSLKNPTGDQRVLNYSGVFDELEDFELNIRGVSGGAGLIVLEGTTDQDPNVKAFDPPNTGRVQLHVNGIPAWDAIVAWTQQRIPSPISPHNGVDPESEVGQQIVLGRELFIAAKCQLCHGGAKWSTSQVDFARVSPFPETLTPGADPEPALAQLARFLREVGTFDATLPIERTANNQTALGKLGYNPPSLLSIFAFPPYLHNGTCPTLACVLENEAHRNAGGTAPLDDEAARAALVQFLISIDGSTEPISP